MGQGNSWGSESLTHNLNSSANKGTRCVRKRGCGYGTWDYPRGRREGRCMPERNRLKGRAISCGSWFQGSWSMAGWLCFLGLGWSIILRQKSMMGASVAHLMETEEHMPILHSNPHQHPAVSFSCLLSRRPNQVDNSNRYKFMSSQANTLNKPAQAMTSLQTKKTVRITTLPSLPWSIKLSTVSPCEKPVKHSQHI